MIRTTLAYALLILLPSLTFSQSITDPQQTDFLVNKIHFIDACMTSYESDETTCSCSFDYLRQHYDPVFYQHPFFTSDGVEPPHEMAESLIESVQYCTYKSAQLDIPRDFYKIQSISTPSRDADY